MICRYTGHAIDPNKDRYITYVWFVDKARHEAHACHEHDLVHRVGTYYETKVITSSMHLEAAMLTHRAEKKPAPPWAIELMDSMKPVEAALKAWERAVWFGGAEPNKDNKVTRPMKYLSECREYKSDSYKLCPEGSLQRFVRRANYKGYCCDVDGVTYTSDATAGRALFQIERGEDRVTVISDETSPEPRSGLQGIHARASVAKELLERAIGDWALGKIKLARSDVSPL